MTEIRFKMQEGQLDFRVGQFGANVYKSRQLPNEHVREERIGFMRLCDVRIAAQALHAAAKELEQVELEYNANMRRNR